MSAFSEKLKNIIQEKQIVINDMAKKCQIEHSTFYKILNGKRLPSSKELIVRMTEYLKLSPDEGGTLLELYDIMKTGGRDVLSEKICKRIYREAECGQRTENHLRSRLSEISGRNLCDRRGCQCQ